MKLTCFLRSEPVVTKKKKVEEEEMTDESEEEQMESGMCNSPFFLIYFLLSFAPHLLSATQFPDK